MTTIAVSNAAQLSSALSAAKGGDTISLAAGNYGDFTLASKNFASDVTITSQSAGAPATFHSLNIKGSSHVVIDGVNVNFTPTATTVSFSPAVHIDGSQFISFNHSMVTGGNAITGVAASATTLDASGNVIGMPTGYGVSVTNSSNVKMDHDNISHVTEGVVLNNVDHLTLSNSDIHDFRKSGVVGGGLNNVTVDNNHIHDSNPWNWGAGDHADYLAFWTNASQTSASTGVVVTNNVMEQGKGTAVLGMWLQGGAAGFTNATISNNAILDGNNQGIVLSQVANSTVDHNTLLQTSGDAKSAPSIILGSGTTDVTVHDNIAGGVTDSSKSAGALANTLSNNQITQTTDSTAAGYYDASLIGKVQAAAPTDSFQAVAKAGINGGIGDLLKAVSSTGATLTASSAAHLVVGGGGNDLLIAGSGNDTFTGGLGADTFRIGYKTGHDVITDFGKGGHDVLDVSAFLKAGLKAMIHDVGADVTIGFSSGETITLTGVHASNLIATSAGFTI